MNPLTNMKNVVKLSERELQNTSGSSWHDQYKDSAWIFIGGLPYDLTEGDIICIFSQYGEVVNINLIRAKDTGKSKGFCFLCYEDQRSTILAVDNFNGIKILKRTIRVDHVQDYKVPKEGKKTDEETKKLYAEGCAPKATSRVLKTEPKQDFRETLADQIEGDIKLPARLPIYTNIKGEKLSDGESEKKTKKKEKKKKKDKKKKSKKKKAKKSESSSDESTSSDSESEQKSTRIKTEKRDRSEERDFRNRDRKEDRGKYSDSKSNRNSTRSSDHSFSSKSERYTSGYNSSSKTSSLKQSDRSRSRDRDKNEKPKSYKRDVSPSIPKRWR